MRFKEFLAEMVDEFCVLSVFEDRTSLYFSDLYDGDPDKKKAIATKAGEEPSKLGLEWAEPLKELLIQHGAKMLAKGLPGGYDKKRHQIVYYFMYPKTKVHELADYISDFVSSNLGDSVVYSLKPVVSPVQEDVGQPLDDEAIAQFRAMKEYFIHKKFGNTKVTDIRPVRHAAVYWHNKTNTYLFLTRLDCEWLPGEKPAGIEDDHFFDIQYWVEWDPKARKTHMVDDDAIRKNARMGGLLMQMADGHPSIMDKIKKKAGRYFGIHVVWPEDLKPH